MRHLSLVIPYQTQECLPKSTLPSPVEIARLMGTKIDSLYNLIYCIYLSLVKAQKPLLVACSA